MERGRLERFLLLLGIGIELGAVLWWAAFYEKVREIPMLAPPGLSLPVPCLVYSPWPCNVIAMVANGFGYWAYNPLAFWAGAAAVGSAFALRCSAARSGGKAEAAAALVAELLPTRRTSSKSSSGPAQQRSARPRNEPDAQRGGGPHHGTFGGPSDCRGPKFQPANPDAEEAKHASAAGRKDGPDWGAAQGRPSWQQDGASGSGARAQNARQAEGPREAHSDRSTGALPTFKLGRQFAFFFCAVLISAGLAIKYIHIPDGELRTASEAVGERSGRPSSPAQPSVQATEISDRTSNDGAVPWGTIALAASPSTFRLVAGRPYFLISDDRYVSQFTVARGKVVGSDRVGRDPDCGNQALVVDAEASGLSSVKACGDDGAIVAWEKPLPPPLDVPAAGPVPDAQSREAQPDVPALPVSAPPEPAPIPPPTFGVPPGLPGKVTSIWSVNGSTVSMVKDGARRRFHYFEPRPGLADSGIRPGMLLYEGFIVGSSYQGQAMNYMKGCEPISFPMTAVLTQDPNQFTLRGRRPLRNAACQIAGYQDAFMTFFFQRSVE